MSKSNDKIEMNSELPIWIMEPEQTEKRDLAARKMFEGGQKVANIPETANINELKERIKRVREYARDNIGSLVRDLETTLSEKYPSIKVKSAADYADAVTYIAEISEGPGTVSTNNSSIVTQELKPKLVENGFTVINSYLHEYDIQKKEIRDYWDLPHLDDKNLTGTFDIAIKMAGLPDIETKEYLALLGVNAISAEDGTTFFLEHFSNIHKDLRLASKVILVVGLDKIVKTRHEAAFQTQCMGIFGLENILLGIEPKPGEMPAIIDDLPLLPSDKERELHLIILDNGRSKLLEGKFRDLFLCIGCRACNKHCPIRHSFTNVDYIWTPKNYLNQFLYGTGQPLDICLHCEACHIECPVDIDLPYLMWQAKLDYVTQHGTSLSHKMLGRPELLAKLGTTFAPIANWAMGLKMIRTPMELITGIDRKTKLPTFHHPFRKRFKKYG